MMSVLEAEAYVIRELRRLGFVVQRYRSQSSNSIYVKVDYGVAQSIRISDHRSKKGVRYRYNVTADTRRTAPYRESEDGTVRHYFPATEDSLRVLVGLICGIRRHKKSKHGEDGYAEFMQEAYDSKKGELGFWQRAEEVL